MLGIKFLEWVGFGSQKLTFDPNQVQSLYMLILNPICTRTWFTAFTLNRLGLGPNLLMYVRYQGLISPTFSTLTQSLELCSLLLI